MHNSNEVRLSDIVELVHGHQFRSEDLNDEMGIPVIKIKQISENGNLDMNNLTYVSNKRLKEFSDFIIKNGDILLSLTGNVGRIVIVKDLNGIALQNYRVGKLVVKPGIDQTYVRYLIESPIVKNQLMKNSNQTAQANFGKQDLNKIKIQLIPYNEQQYVGKLLENIDEIITKLDNMIETRNELVKIQFIKMFGSPMNNSKNIKTEKITNVCKIIDGDRGKNYPKSEDFFSNEYCLFLNAKNVTANGFSFNNCMFITKEKDNSLRNGKLEREDIVLTTRGTVGNIAFYAKDIPFKNIRINSGMVILRMNKEIINEVFFIEQFKLQLDNVKNKIASGSAQPQLPISTMKAIKVLIPSLKQQNQFAKIVKQIDKQKFLLERQKQNYENLKIGLMQQLLTGKVRVKI